MRRPGWVPDPRPWRRTDLGVRPGESDPARGLGVAVLLALVIALAVVAVVIVLAGVW